MKRTFMICMMLLCSYATIGFAYSKVLEVSIEAWTCSACRHGNPESVKECEYCGKTR
ncbi:MAG: hypothetical protein AB7N99_06590 [Simkaniaceae bacterium]